MAEFSNAAQAANPSARLLTTLEAAETLRLSVSTLNKWRVYGSGPAFVRLGGNRVFYRECDLQEFVSKNLFSSTAEAGLKQYREASDD